MNKQVLKLLLLIVLSFQGLFNATAQYSGGAFLYSPSGTLARFTPSVSGDIIGCDSVILTASGGASYYWSGGVNHSSVSYTALSSGTYTVTVVNSGGCTASLSKSVTVIKPTATISGSTMGCDSVVLTASGGIDYLWNSDAGTNSAVNRVLMSGMYKVTVTDEYGCTASASTTVQVNKQPILTGLSPINGNTGTLAVINGSNLNGVTGITFNGVAASGFSIINDNEIHATLPVSGQVQILEATSLCGTASLDILPPVVTGFQPSSGPPGTLVTIAGSNLYNLNNVTVGGTQALVIKSTPGSVVAYIMPGTQSGTIAVNTGLGSAVTSGIFTVTATPYPYFQQGNKLTAEDKLGNIQSGTGVAISADGNTAVVGAPQDNSGTGAIRVFVRNGTTWTLQGSKLTGTGATGTARQGTSVAIGADGNVIAAGGPGDNNNTGAVWVFRRNGTNWSQIGSKLTGSGANGASQFGSSVSMCADGNTLAVGGLADDSYAGATWVFSQTGNSWTQMGGKLFGSGAVGKSRQGASVALSADASTLLTGGYNDNNRQGAVWVFVKNNGNWLQEGTKLVGSGGSTQAWQGYSISISANGNTVLVGGPNDNSLTGASWVFNRINSTWSQQGGRLVGNWSVGSSRQGCSTGLSADGNTAIWGGYGDNSNAGAYWAYKRNGTIWVQQGGKLTGTGAAGAARQATGLGLSATGATAVIGGPADATNKGAVWVFIPGAQAYSQWAEQRIKSMPDEKGAFILYQNAPNPHTGSTSIGFRLPAPCRAVWQITDASGRMVMEMTRDYPAGYNEEIFELSGLSGVFEYSLTTPWGVRARKMVVVR